MGLPFVLFSSLLTPTCVNKAVSHQEMDTDQESSNGSLPTVSIPPEEWKAVANGIGKVAGNSGEDMDMFRQGRKSSFPNGVK